MKHIFVNLKRFDVPRSKGGICQMDDPKGWIEWVVAECVKSGIGKSEEVEISFLLPENLVIPAVQKLACFAAGETKSINIGCQGVFRKDVVKGGNFGAFTTNRPAAAMSNIGCKWAIIGHSEERRDKLEIMALYDTAIMEDIKNMSKAKAAVDSIINEEVLCALNAGIGVLMCIGETAEEKGDGSFEEQKPRIREVLESQLKNGLKNMNKDQIRGNIVIGYEPIWAIGPGRIPPGAEYIVFVSSYIKEVVADMFGITPDVVYGGGLKEENAKMIAGIDTIDGGLVALTKFSGDIGFYPEDLVIIIGKYL